MTVNVRCLHPISRINHEPAVVNRVLQGQMQYSKVMHHSLRSEPTARPAPAAPLQPVRLCSLDIHRRELGQLPLARYPTVAMPAKTLAWTPPSASAAAIPSSSLICAQEMSF